MTELLNPHIFREYDIRGTVDRDLTPAVAEQLGRAIGTALRRRGGRTLTVGCDNRLSSPSLATGLISGLLAAGCDVTDIGMVPTPLLYFSLFHLAVDGGVMITGSHNPPEYNGFKIALGTSTIHGAEIRALRGLVEKRDFETGAGTLAQIDVTEPYCAMITSKIRIGRPLKVVVDAGSGAGGPIAARLIRELGCEVIELWCEPDGRYPGHFPDPTVPANLEQAIRVVRETGADLGVAYDGDADRLGAIDDTGRIVWGDQLMIIFSREILRRRPGAAFVFEVKCSRTLEEDIRAHGGRPILWKVGHSLIKAKMKEEGALLAGEMSGHLFFADDYFGYDDAIYASLRLLEIVAAHGRPSALLADVPQTFSTPEIRVECPDAEKFAVVAAVLDHFRARYAVIDVDGARISFADGWGLVRASNTQPVLVVRFEAATEESLDANRREVAAFLARFPAVILPPEMRG